MAMKPRGKPADLAPEPWPDAPSDDEIGEVARQFAANLRSALGSRSMNSLAKEIGISPQTILNVLAGQTWPDLSTIARLEVGLKAPLYPRRPSNS